MSKQLAELCSLLVEDIYGELPSRIFSVLIQYSRLNVDQIRARTFLPAKVVKSGLAVLVQHNLVFYFAPRPYVPTSFQANWRQAYDILRVGKYADLVQRRLGDDALAAFEWFKQGGRMSVEGVLKAERDHIKAQCQAIDKREADETLREERLGTKEDKLDEDHPKTNGDHHPNGVHKPAPNELRPVFTDERRKELKTAIQALIDRGFVGSFRYIDTLSDLDATALVQETIRRGNAKLYGKTMGPKVQEAFNTEVSNKMLQIKSGHQTLHDPMTLRYEKIGEETSGEDGLGGSRGAGRTFGRTTNSKKRSREEDEDDVEGQPSLKKQRREEPRVSELDRRIFRKRNVSDAHYHVDSTRLCASLRNDALIEFCLRRLGENATRVYTVILELIEKETLFCFNRYDDSEPVEGASYLESLPRVQAKVVAAAMDAESLERLKPRGRDDEDKDKSRDKRKGKDGASSMSQSPELRPQDVRPPVNGAHKPRPVGNPTPGQITNVLRYMDMLASEPHGLLTRVAVSNDRGSSSYKVNFHQVVRKLIQFEIESMVQQRFGSEPARLLRILDAKGRLDEKQLVNLGLVLQKNMRAHLTKLQDAGFINTQEVPRDNSRNPSRTIFLWFYDQDRCREAIVDDAYKAMARLMQRARADREEIHFVIEKSQRTDVKGREHELMTESELRLLHEFHEKEKRIMVQLARQDSVVTLFRDYLPFKPDRPVKVQRGDLT